MEDVEALGKALPLYAMLPSMALFVVLLVVLLRRMKNTPTRFLIFAMWFRYVMSANHMITYEPSPLGLSWNAIGSCLVAGVGLLLIRRRPLFHPLLFPFYVLLAIMLVSAGVNGTLGGAINAVVKYAYLIVLMLMVMDAAEDIGANRLLTYMIWPFAVPFVLQIESVVLGVSKMERLANSISYIGGFNHEAAFSITLGTGLLVISLNQRLRLWLKLLLIACGGVGLLLANYRTAIIAMLPMLLFSVLMSITGNFVSRQRATVGSLLAAFLMAGALGGAVEMQERFVDIEIAISESGRLMKPRSQYTPDEERILSGRPAIWSGYIYGWYRGGADQHLVGFGPDSWVQFFHLYAHNTLVSTLYELGICGVIAMLFLWLWMLALSFRTRPDMRPWLVTAHVSFILLNMATMPLWQIEGTIFYAILCGLTGYYAQPRSAAARRRGPVRSGWPADRGVAPARGPRLAGVQRTRDS